MSEHKAARRGHSVVEVSLMVPWILLLFMAVFDFGFYSYAAIATANAARVGALYASTSPSAAQDSAGACMLVVEEMRRLPNVGAATCACATGSCSAGPVTVTATPVDAGASADGAPATRVLVSYQTINLMPLPFFPGQMTINRRVEARVRD